MESRWSSSRRPLDTGGRRAARETLGTHRHDALPIRLAGMAGGAGDVTVSRRRSSRLTPRDTFMSRLFPLPALSTCRPRFQAAGRSGGSTHVRTGDRRALVDWHSSPQHDGQPLQACRTIRDRQLPKMTASAALRARAGQGECRCGVGYWFGALAGGACRSSRADRAVSQPKPVMMLARWNSPPRLTSRGDWPKPAAARAMVASMVTAVPAL
jgi:hypothetical protein